METVHRTETTLSARKSVRVLAKEQEKEDHHRRAAKEEDQKKMRLWAAKDKEAENGDQGQVVGRKNRKNQIEDLGHQRNDHDPRGLKKKMRLAGKDMEVGEGSGRNLGRNHLQKVQVVGAVRRERHEVKKDVAILKACGSIMALS
ncbi:hypothetical protein MTO96_004231 [Rhipicephalus appendiculatus]